MNKRLLLLYIVFFLSAMTSSAVNAQVSQEVVALFEERTFQYTGGKYQDEDINYRLLVPENIRPGRKYPLVVHLHGIGEAGSCNTVSLLFLDLVLPIMTGPKRQDFFLLVTQCPADTPGWNFRPTQDGTLDVLSAAIEHVTANNPIDRRRITATGLSSGGWGVWALILRHPDLFAGALPTSCSAPQQLQSMTALTRTPVWHINNRGDIDPQSLLMAMHTIRNAGGTMVLTEADAPGHNAWIPTMVDYNGIQWMLAQKRGSWFAPPPGVIVHNNPRPLFFAFMLYVIPLAVVVFFTWRMMFEWTSTAYQSMRLWSSR